MNNNLYSREFKDTKMSLFVCGNCKHKKLQDKKCGPLTVTSAPAKIKTVLKNMYNKTERKC